MFHSSALDTPIAQGLERCAVKFLVVCSNPTDTYVCEMFPLTLYLKCDQCQDKTDHLFNHFARKVLFSSGFAIGHKHVFFGPIGDLILLVELISLVSVVVTAFEPTTWMFAAQCDNLWAVGLLFILDVSWAGVT